MAKVPVALQLYTVRDQTALSLIHIWTLPTNREV